MEKKDLKKEYKTLYTGRNNEAVIVEVPELNYLMIDGKGDPNNSGEFNQAVEALYTLAYTIKFLVKKKLEKDFTVMPLEGLWWVDAGEEFSLDNKKNWLWTLMILQPDFITENIFEEALRNSKNKKPELPLEKIKLEKYNEGRSVQLLYTGPYKDEKPSIEKIHAFAASNGFSLHKKHHEIYLSDMRKTPPEKLKTILRNPIK